MKCPHEKAILNYAARCGLQNARVVNHPWYGWELRGGGETKDGWPLAWAVAGACGIRWGCGNPDQHQIKPENFVRTRKIPRTLNEAGIMEYRRENRRKRRRP